MSEPRAPRAALVIIGDEILTGKYPDQNGPFAIGLCRARGIDLVRISIIPDRVELNLNHRFAPTTSLERAEQNVRALVADSGVNASIEIIDRSPAALPFAAHPLVQRLARAGVVAVEPKQAWTDVARFAALGVPAVNWGPGTQAQAHQPDEWTSVSTLVAGRAILRGFLTGTT